jgi:hypothetical protein
MKNMETLRRLSPIDRIHTRGMCAIINGDSLTIVGEVRPDDVPSKIIELEKTYADVSEDADGDIVFHRDVDD